MQKKLYEFPFPEKTRNKHLSPCEPNYAPLIRGFWDTHRRPICDSDHALPCLWDAAQVKGAGECRNLIELFRCSALMSEKVSSRGLAFKHRRLDDSNMARAHSFDNIIWPLFFLTIDDECAIALLQRALHPNCMPVL